jgi:hypothetical protein
MHSCGDVVLPSCPTRTLPSAASTQLFAVRYVGVRQMGATEIVRPGRCRCSGHKLRSRCDLSLQPELAVDQIGANQASRGPASSTCLPDRRGCDLSPTYSTPAGNGSSYIHAFIPRATGVRDRVPATRVLEGASARLRGASRIRRSSTVPRVRRGFVAVGGAWRQSRLRSSAMIPITAITAARMMIAASM